MLKKIGILGGGQLGRMLQEVAQKMNLPVWCMDKTKDSPAALFRDFFVQGDILNYDDVINFSADKDIITVEIEHVNLDALKELESQGKEVHPNPHALGIIKNKNKQKEFYSDLGIPVPIYWNFSDKNEALEIFSQWRDKVPFIYKSAEMGYDGKGVRTIRLQQDVEDLDNVAGSFEEKINIEIEVAVMIARSTNGKYVIYPPVGMYFDEGNHILSEVHYPIQLSSDWIAQMNDIAVKVTESLNICGLCAFEFFITTQGQVILNEIAPRPHNSMHISMNNAVCSQFEQHIRAISGLPLGSPVMDKKGIMYNIIGKDTDFGPTNWIGWENVLGMENVFIHLYGKSVIKPARKMGHINIVGEGFTQLKEKLHIIKDQFKNNNNG
ncbi:MAG: 5-(carboxyamino)imidazole ribonucleotide synthase [Saprospiraceae bacterium]|nr:5-(carboxyamino)imidazole ribonucleotide synthase [Saprospiraceae bacterium]